MSDTTLILDMENNGDAMLAPAEGGSIIFGITIDIAPHGSAPTDNLELMIGDTDTAAKVGPANGLAYITMKNQNGGFYQFDYPAGRKVFNGLSGMVISNNHGTVTVVIDHA